jgi:sugar/nucleoside kinase (ribokinase family)
MSARFPVRGVLCSGALICDTVVRPVDEAPWGTTTFVETLDWHVGGNGSNTSLALARLGVPVRVLGWLGRDQAGEFVVERLRRAGVDTSLVARSDPATAATIVIVNSVGNRKFLHRLGVSAEAFAEPIDFESAARSEMSHYHLASLFILPRLREHAAQTLADARSAGLTTSLDTNWDALGRWMETLGPCLPHLDLLFMNEDEARMTTGTDDAAEAARIVREQGVRVAVMKLGGRGCAVFGDGFEIRCPAYEVEVRDTTGAGDCFVAGFLAALHRGASLEEAGRFANAVGALAVEQVGAVTGMRPYAEVAAWMAGARIREEPGGKGATGDRGADRRSASH